MFFSFLVVLVGRWLNSRDADLSMAAGVVHAQTMNVRRGG
jgi:hypothetical protein